MIRRRLLQSSIALSTARSVVRASAQSSSPVPSPAAGIAPFQTVEIDGVDIAYRVRGAGDPLVLVMGLTGAMDQWDDRLLAALAGRFTVITFDNRGAGSSGPTEDYPFTRLADDVAALIDALGQGSAHVLGWSMGAMVAMDLGIRHPRQVRSLVLHAGNPGGGDAVLPGGEILSLLTATAGSPESNLATKIRLMVPADYAREHRDELVGIFSRPSAPVSAECARQQVTALLDWQTARQPLETIAAPTLVLQGADDLICPAANATRIADRIPEAWLVRLPGGHGLQYQVPGTMAHLIAAFHENGASQGLW